LEYEIVMSPAREKRQHPTQSDRLALSNVAAKSAFSVNTSMALPFIQFEVFDAYILP
jgi:hypothetical protein